MYIGIVYDAYAWTPNSVLISFVDKSLLAVFTSCELSHILSLCGLFASYSVFALFATLYCLHSLHA